MHILPIFDKIQIQIANFLLNKEENSHFYPLLCTFLANLRYIQILSRITRKSPPIGPLSPPMCPPPLGGDGSPPMPESVWETLAQLLKFLENLGP